MTFDEAEKYIYARFKEANVTAHVNLDRECDYFHKEDLDETFEKIINFVETKHKPR